MRDVHPLPDDTSILSWLETADRVAVFGFSEDPFHVGYLGEVLAQALAGSALRADLYLWSRATSYDGLAALHPNAAVRRAETTLGAVGFAGGYAALRRELAALAGDRLTVDERKSLPSPTTDATADVLRDPLRDAVYLGTPVGWAMMASLAELTRSAHGHELADEALVTAMVTSYASVFDAATAELTRTRPQAVLVFNGRLLHESAVREAASQLGIPTIVAEVGHAPDHFSLHWMSAHDRAQYARRMQHAWEGALTADADAAHEVAASWFLSRRTGSGTRNPYVTRQAMGTLPELEPGRRRVVYFTSSDDEFLSAGADWLSPLGTQEQILDLLVGRAEAASAVQLVIRMHPHTLLKNSRDQEWWRQFRERTAGKHTCVVPPESPVDSYALAESADVVLTIGSTIGIEAAFLGVPSVTLGPTLYDSLGVTSPVTEIDDALFLSLDEAELAARRLRTLPWGYYWSTFGLPLRYFEASPPLFSFSGRPLARRGRLQSLVPGAVTRRRRDAEFEKRTGVKKASEVL